MKRDYFYILIGAACLFSKEATCKTTLTSAQKKEIAQHLWHNEASKRYDRLVFWNVNEKFPSLGICHFIWYPAKNTDIYTQTFPDLLTHFKKNKVKLPPWLDQAQFAPWQTREEFVKQETSAQVEELRKLLFDTMDLQVDFIIERLERAWPRMLNVALAEKRQQVECNFNLLMQSPQGVYALLDYLNFKGEGTDPKERYNNIGWGLLQVLENMGQVSGNAVAQFAAAAKSVLTTRTENAPSHKAHEKNWLPGWFNRLNTYTNS